MNADEGVRLLDLYARAQAALTADRLDEAGGLVTEAGAILDRATPPDADPATILALASQVDGARSAALDALGAARQRLLAAANRELRAGGGGARAYSPSDDRPDARFIDRTG